MAQRRPKDQRGPSKSSQAAELFQATGGRSAFDLFVSGGDVADTSIDADLRVVLKKLQKKDSTTKVKALQELSEMVAAKSAEEFSPALPDWVSGYLKLAYDNERRVRELANVAMQQIAEKVKRSLAPHIKALLGPWTGCMVDPAREVQAAAVAAFNGAFSSPAKRAEVFVFAHAELCQYLADTFKHTVQTLSDMKTTSPEEAEERYERVIATSVLTWKYLIDTVPEAELVKHAEKHQSLLTESPFLKLANSKYPMVRSSVFSFILSAIKANQTSKSIISGHLPAISPSVLGSFQEKEPSVHAALWPCVLTFMKEFTDSWQHVNVRKQVLPRMFAFLRSEAPKSPNASFPCALPLIQLIPRDVMCTPAAEGFLDEFLGSLWKGAKSDLLTAPGCSTLPAITAFVECSLWACVNAGSLAGENAAALIAHVLRQHVLTFMQALLHCPRLYSPVESTSNLAAALFAKLVAIPTANEPVTSFLSEHLLPWCQSVLFAPAPQPEAEASQQSPTEKQPTISVSPPTPVTRQPPTAGSGAETAAVTSAVKPKAVPLEPLPSDQNDSSLMCVRLTVWLNALAAKGVLASSKAPLVLLRPLFSQCLSPPAGISSKSRDGLLALAATICECAHLGSLIDDLSEDSRSLEAFFESALLPHFVLASSSQAESSLLTSVVGQFLALTPTPSEHWVRVLNAWKGCTPSAPNCTTLGVLVKAAVSRSLPIPSSETDQLFSDLISKGLPSLADAPRCDVLSMLITSGLPLVSQPTASRLLSLARDWVAHQQKMASFRPMDSPAMLRVLSLVNDVLNNRNKFSLDGEWSVSMVRALIGLLVHCADGDVSDPEGNVPEGSVTSVASAMVGQLLPLVPNAKEVVGTQLADMWAHEVVSGEAGCSHHTLARVYGILTATKAQGDETSPLLPPLHLLMSPTPNGGASVWDSLEQSISGKIVLLDVPSAAEDHPYACACLPPPPAEGEEAAGDNENPEVLVACALFGRLVATALAILKNGGESNETLIGRLLYARSLPTVLPEEVLTELDSFLSEKLRDMSGDALASLLSHLISQAFPTTDTPLTPFSAAPLLLTPTPALAAIQILARKNSTALTAIDQSKLSPAQQAVLCHAVRVCDLPVTVVDQCVATVTELSKEIGRAHGETSALNNALGNLAIGLTILSDFLESVNRDGERDEQKTVDCVIGVLTAWKKGLLEDLSGTRKSGASAELFMNCVGCLARTCEKIVALLSGEGNMSQTVRASIQSHPESTSLFESVFSTVKFVYKLVGNANAARPITPATVCACTHAVALCRAIIENSQFSTPALLQDTHVAITQALCLANGECEATPGKDRTHDFSQPILAIIDSAALSVRPRAREISKNVFEVLSDTAFAEICVSLLLSKNIYAQTCALELTTECLLLRHEKWLENQKQKREEMERRQKEKQERGSGGVEYDSEGEEDSDEGETEMGENGESDKTDATTFLPPAVLSLLTQISDLAPLTEKPTPRSLVQYSVWDLKCPEALGHFMVWHAVTRLVQKAAELTIVSGNGSSKQHTNVVKQSISAFIKENKLEEGLLNALCSFTLSPTSETHTLAEARSERADAVAKFRPADLTHSRQSLAGYCGHVYSHMVQAFPSIVRSWFNQCERSMTNMIEKFTMTRVSPLSIERELEIISQNAPNFAASGLTVRAYKPQRQITATYSQGETSLEITIKIPQSFPLKGLEVESTKRHGVSEAVWRKWMLHMTTVLFNFDASVWEAIVLWRDNLDSFFKGVSDCVICYSVVHMSDGSLPKKQCKTCKNKFHSACLFKWFQTSHNSQCPLCRTPF